MLNNYNSIQKQINDTLLLTDKDFIQQALKEIDSYVEKIIYFLQTDNKKNVKAKVMLDNFFTEITTFLSLCSKTDDYKILEKDIKFSLKIIHELGSELEKQFLRLYQSDIIDTNAEMKLLEHMLTEEGFFDD